MKYFFKSPRVAEIWNFLSPEQGRAINKYDEERLKLERARVPERVAVHIKEANYSFKNRFGAWEIMIKRMENGWGSDNFYDPAEYINNLIVRDGIDEVIAEYPVLGQPPLDGLLAELDSRFMEYSVYDGGAELALWRPKGENFAEKNERWKRKPTIIPWK